LSAAPQITDETPAEFFSRTGVLPTGPNDARRFPRYFFRSVAEAFIYKLSGNDPPDHCFVLTRDLSRGGVSVLHIAPLFPGQRLDLVLSGQTPRLVEVVRCRRLKDGRYLVGCQFKKCPGDA
jgi:hypothetical protein